MGAIYLIRHGQASFEAEDYDQLSAKGEQQARILGTALRQRLGSADVRVSGSLRRQQQTAAACLEAYEQGTGVDTDPGWNEYDDRAMLRAFEPSLTSGAALQDWLRQRSDPRAAFQELFLRAATRWSSGEADGDYQESWTGFRERVGAALERVQQRLERSQQALVFTSAGVIATVCGILLSLPAAQVLQLNWTIANASVTKLLVGRSGLSLSSFNEHAHLETPERAMITYR